MKKKTIWTIVLMMILTLGLAGCGGSNNEEESEPAPEAAADGKTLVAYFSWSGNTEEVAQMIQEETGGDLFEITTETPYTEDYNELLDVAQEEQRDQARPALSSQVENWDEYSTIFVGYPCWWGDAPMAVLTFLESYDFTGKQLVPFTTHGGSGFGRSLESIEGSAGNATILEGFEVSDNSISGAADDVATWIQGLSLGQ